MHSEGYVMGDLEESVSETVSMTTGSETGTSSLAVHSLTLTAPAMIVQS